MTDYWLSRAGVRMRRQIDRRWPKRDKASEGWIGDPSHAARPSDHNPCWTCAGDRYGVVRAIDIDSSMGGKAGYNTTPEAWRLANQIRAAMRMGDRRISYIIAYDPDAKNTKIASMNPDYSPLGGWRDYSGRSHENHIHVSFTPRGDHDGDPFELPILNVRVARLTVAIRKIADTISDLRAELRRKRRTRKKLKG
jgi:hypothetical protein